MHERDMMAQESVSAGGEWWHGILFKEPNPTGGLLMKKEKKCTRVNLGLVVYACVNVCVTVCVNGSPWQHGNFIQRT